MKRLIPALALLALLAGASAQAQSTTPQRRATLAYLWDMDGEAADDDQVVTVATLADSTTFALAAQPDSCRLIDATVVDADSSITAGTLTATGTDCLGYARVCVHTFTGAGSGVKTFTVSSGSGTGCYLGAVTSVISSALTGEGGAGDTLKVGYASNSVVGWPMYGTLKAVGPNGEHGVDPLAQTDVLLPITTGGTLSTSLTAISNNNAFASVLAGDLILVQGDSYIVTVKTSVNAVTVHKGVVLPAGGVTFAYRRPYFSTDPTDQMSFEVEGYRTLLLTWAVAANANTGGVQMIIQGAIKGPGWPSANWATLCPTSGVDCVGITKTVASGATQLEWPESIRLNELPFTHLRVGFKFGSGDDADAAAESISAAFKLLQ